MREIPIRMDNGKQIAFVRLLEENGKVIVQFVRVRDDGQESLKYGEVIEK